MFPRAVALVTSPTGAAIRDMLRVIRRRCPSTRVIVCPVRVQATKPPARSPTASPSSTGSRRSNDDRRPGGGSSMICGVQRGSGRAGDRAPRIPVISAVGHETDFTISDFVADLRALTPTGRGESSRAGRQGTGGDLDSCRRRLGRALTRERASAREQLAGLAQRCEPRRFENLIRERNSTWTNSASGSSAARNGRRSSRASAWARSRAGSNRSAVRRVAARLQHHAPRAARRRRPRRRRPAPRRSRPAPGSIAANSGRGWKDFSCAI